MSESLIFTHDLKKLRKLRTLSAIVSCVMAFGFAFDLYILIIGYHPANRVHQFAWLPAYALGACAWFLWFRAYSARIAMVTRSTIPTEPKS